MNAMKDRDLPDGLESDVLSRIALHRQSENSTGALPVALPVAHRAGKRLADRYRDTPQRNSSPHGSEAALLAEDVALTPSSLLVSNR